jgi:DNA-binding NarL/FixJ family response regulator
MPAVKTDKKSSALINKKKKVLLVDDHPVFKYGLTQLISQTDNLVICGDADNLTDAMRLIKESSPDIAVVDLNLQNSSGFDLLKEISNYKKSIPVLILTMYEDINYVERALRMGARGYLNKKETFTLVIKAIYEILDGNIFLNEDISGNIIKNIVAGDSELNGSLLKKLTDREFSVFKLIGEGKSTKEIAKNMNLSINTVNTYKERIKEKLNIKNFTDLIQTAVKWLNKSL